MRVGIDLTALLPAATGVDVSLLGLVRHLAAIDRDTAYSLLVNREDRDHFVLLPANFAIVPLSLRPRPARLAFQQVLLPAAAALLRLDVVHSPSFILPLVRGRARHLLTVHDLTFDTLPHVHIPLRRSRAFRAAVAHSIRRADLVTVPSRSVASVIRARLPDVDAGKLRVVPWGIADEFRPQSPGAIADVRARLGLPERYLLFVGTIEPRKNLPVLLEAYRRVAAHRTAPPHLVLAGRPGWGVDEVLALARTPALRPLVHIAGYVPQADLPALYTGALLLAYPSLEEGFGFPPLEAMACGVPVLASTGSALSENLGGAAELVSCDDVDGFADAIERLIADADLRRARRQQGFARAAAFRWTETAAQMRSSYSELAAHGDRRDVT